MSDLPVYPVPERRRLLVALRDTSWSWAEDAAAELAQQWGWVFTKLPPRLLDSGVGLGHRSVQIDYRDGRTDGVVIRLTGLATEDGAAVQLVLSDVFADTISEAVEVFGAPSGRSSIADTQAVRWRLAEATVQVRRLPSVVEVSWMSNESQDFWDALEPEQP